MVIKVINDTAGRCNHGYANVAAVTTKAATVVMGLNRASGGGGDASNHPSGLLNRPRD